MLKKKPLKAPQSTAKSSKDLERFWKRKKRHGGVQKGFKQKINFYEFQADFLLLELGNAAHLQKT